MKTNLFHIISTHKRGIKELHKVSPKLFPIITLTAVLAALIPYVTVFFSARILTELATFRRADILWQWVILGVSVTGIFSITNAFLHQRYITLSDDVWGRKEILFCRKMFSMDYADIDKQEIHDLRAQIAQNENWAGWGFMCPLSSRQLKKQKNLQIKKFVLFSPCCAAGGNFRQAAVEK